MKTNFNRAKIAGLVVIIVMVSIGGYFVGGFLPTVGNHDTPANSNVSDYYIENAVKDTNSPNIVTAVLADYRGFDTLFETCVLFLSGIVALMTLSTKQKVRKKERHEEKTFRLATQSFGGRVFDTAFRVIVPILAIYGVYVLLHGEISLGGGFQAGALLGCAYLLDRITPSANTSLRIIPEETAVVIAGVGTFIYAFTGMLSMLNNGNFLEFGALPIPIEEVRELHSIGIFLVELGVTICVMAVIINILEVVLERTEFDD